MDTQFERIQSVLDRADISIAELAQMTGITKATLQGWKSGKHKADQFRLNIVTGYINLIEKATTLGKLPLTQRIRTQTRAWRVDAIRTVLHEVRKAG